MSRQAVRETLGFLGVIASMIFVGLEIRQNTIASRASAYQAIGIATAERHASIAGDPDLARLQSPSADELRSMTRTDWERIIRDEIAWHRLGETVYLQVEEGLLPPDAMSRLGYADGFTGFRSACVWPSIRERVGESYRAFMERTVNFGRHDCVGIPPTGS